MKNVQCELLASLRIVRIPLSLSSCFGYKVSSHEKRLDGTSKMLMKPINHPRMLLAGAALWLAISLPSSSTVQAQNHYANNPQGVANPNEFAPGMISGIDSSNIARSDFFVDSAQPSSGRPSGIPIGLQAEWLADSEFGLATAGASLKVPLLFARRDADGPPPIVKFGFAYTDLFAAESFGLPGDLYETSVGLSWMRRFNNRWSVRSMLGIAYASDNRNTSSDAWQFRGGVFAICKTSEQWQWTIGAIALGRRDLPVLPAIGAVWQPNLRTRVDFLLPQPKVNYLLNDDGRRQQWAYFGGGLNGSTWGYESETLGDDQLTYSDLRIVAGWESRPTPPPGSPFGPGRKFNIEFGYAFSRDFEFDDRTVEVELDDSLLLRVSTSF